ncbi:MAG TPA: hypothetical protein VMP08_23760 [Anaerolineae bacterium]|nr:hypothetical protein [Anaerolineae bacterium]
MSIPKLDGSTELTIVQCMARDLEEYLKSDVLYWHVAEPNPLGRHMPQLTIGALLEAITRAAAAQNELTSDQREALEAARAQLDRIRAAHAARFVSKAIHELHGRLGAWKANLDDESRKSKSFYAQDARVRAKIFLLEKALGADVPVEVQKFREQIDLELFEVFVPGEFIWDARLQAAFPKDPCWWLYGHWLEEHYS